MFGGLDICSLEAVVAKDGKEYIIEVNDSATGLLGESQEDDRKHIAELVLKNMEVYL
jgi:glutathione synthase/RimK-type ligase-like ATP-grasp enzyme